MRVRKIRSVVLSFRWFVCYNQTEICLLCVPNRRQTSVYKPGAVQNSVLCEVDITILELAMCCTNNLSFIKGVACDALV